MVRAALVAAVALGLARDCGGADNQSGANGPCTRTKDCTAGLVCSEGVCQEPDAGATDAGMGDAADGGG